MRANWKRGVTVLTVLVLVLAVTSVALAAGSVAGTYATTVKSPPQIKGKWVLTFAEGGSYKVALNGRLLARGTYSATETTITLREPAGNGCGGSGTYAWKRSGSSMRFVRKREAPTCQVRAAVLAHPFTVVR